MIAIKGISANPTIVYRYGEQTAAYVKELAGFGAHPIDPMGLERDGFVHLHLSDQIEHREAMAIASKNSTSLVRLL